MSDNTVKVNGKLMQLPRNYQYVEGGTFEMGSEEGWKNEKPVHLVTVKSFYIDRYPLTQLLCLKLAGKNPSKLIGETRPVDSLNWNEANQYIKIINARTGFAFRLPTEAEWEYAARGGKYSKKSLFAGGNNLDELAWYGENGRGESHPVSKKKPNELDLYDMSGNVWEWCSDWYSEYKAEAVSNPHGPVTGETRVLRGGSWLNDETHCTVSVRINLSPTLKASNIGLRLAHDV